MMDLNQIKSSWEWMNFCPKCGAPNQVDAPARKIPFHCLVCQYIQYFNPSIGVVAIVVDPSNRCLLLTRQKQPQKGKLGLPGGFADFGESAEDGVLREIAEETGLTPHSIRYLCSDINNYPYQGVLYRVLDLFFVCQVDNFQDLVLQDSEVASPVITVPTQNHLLNMAFDSNRKALVQYYQLDPLREDHP